MPSAYISVAFSSREAWNRWPNAKKSVPTRSNEIIWWKFSEKLWCLHVRTSQKKRVPVICSNHLMGPTVKFCEANHFIIFIGLTVWTCSVPRDFECWLYLSWPHMVIEILTFDGFLLLFQTSKILRARQYYGSILMIGHISSYFSGRNLNVRVTSFHAVMSCKYETEMNQFCKL